MLYKYDLPTACGSRLISNRINIRTTHFFLNFYVCNFEIDYDKFFAVSNSTNDFDYSLLFNFLTQFKKRGGFTIRPYMLLFCLVLNTFLIVIQCSFYESNCKQCRRILSLPFRFTLSSETPPS